jgi:hypothetical protein
MRWPSGVNRSAGGSRWERAIAGRIGRGHGRGPVLPNRMSRQNVSNAQVLRLPTTLFFQSRYKETLNAGFGGLGMG